MGIVLSCCQGNSANAIKKPTFTEHIAPIIHKHCSGCHREGGVAPFSLITYEQVKKKAKTIAKVTKNRFMPPWPADPKYSHFIGENFLSEIELETIQNWVIQKTPEGNKGKLAAYAPPNWQSNIGKPDLVLALDTVQLYPDFRDRFFLMKIAGLIPSDTWVRAVEFVAGTQDQVHHFNGHLLLYDFNAKKNIFEGMKRTEISNGEYDQDFGHLKLQNDDGSYPLRIHSAVNYLPGVMGTAYPNGIGTFRLTRKFAFVGNDMHFGPGDQKTVDHSFINVFYSKTPPSREVAEIMLGTNGVSEIVPPLKILPNTESKHVTKFLVPKDISVLTINPHLHLLGKSFLAYAIKPNGDTVKLIRIAAWDFRWQYFYTFTKMVPIPKGSTIFAEATFDNTANNPNNPNNPPKLVGERLEYGGASMRAADEMFQFIITYSIYQKGDENVSLER